MLMRWRTPPAVVAALLLTAGILFACDDGDRVQSGVSAAASVETAGETGRPPEVAPPPPEERTGGEGSGGQDARQAGERAHHVAVEAIERAWERTKDTARQTGEALAGATGDADRVIGRIWEQTKERARRTGDVMEETATAADRALGLAWQHTKDAAQRMSEAWGRGRPADDDDETAGEVRL